MEYGWRAIVEKDGQHYLGCDLEFKGEEEGAWVTAIGKVFASDERYRCIEESKYYLVEQRDFEGKKLVKRIVAESETPILNTKGMVSVNYIQMKGTRGMMKQTWNLVAMTGKELQEQSVLHWETSKGNWREPNYVYVPHFDDLNEY
ncbi:hypothetical protein ACQUY5_16795 [Bacillus cereus]|uniref:hypothetical protein n=1 Tax=Bacillus cereus TaxID=1396 RepID=UPI003D17AF4E